MLQSVLSVFNNFAAVAEAFFQECHLVQVHSTSMRVSVAMLAHMIRLVPQLWLFCHNNSVGMQ